MDLGLNSSWLALSSEHVRILSLMGTSQIQPEVSHQIDPYPHFHCHLRDQTPSPPAICFPFQLFAFGQVLPLRHEATLDPLSTSQFLAHRNFGDQSGMTKYSYGLLTDYGDWSRLTREWEYLRTCCIVGLSLRYSPCKQSVGLLGMQLLPSHPFLGSTSLPLSSQCTSKWVKRFR
jgi:hypothetical protein